jgi:N-acyl-D-aspartate/D-glutamate deacylase
VGLVYDIPMKLGAVLLLSTLCRAQTHDLLIRGGCVVDGTGNPSLFADVAVKDGKIAAMGRLAGAAATKTIDAAGLTVTPGFIDIVSLSNPHYKQFEGKRMNEVIRALNKPPIDALFVVAGEQQWLGANCMFPSFRGRHALRHATAVGFHRLRRNRGYRDRAAGRAGNPHPLYCGTFPRVLGRYARDEKVGCCGRDWSPT